jgi:hypothetical protein
LTITISNGGCSCRGSDPPANNPGLFQISDLLVGAGLEPARLLHQMETPNYYYAFRLIFFNENFQFTKIKYPAHLSSSDLPSTEMLVLNSLSSSPPAPQPASGQYRRLFAACPADSRIYSKCVLLSPSAWLGRFLS